MFNKIVNFKSKFYQFKGAGFEINSLSKLSISNIHNYFVIFSLAAIFAFTPSFSLNDVNSIRNGQVIIFSYVIIVVVFLSLLKFFSRNNFTLNLSICDVLLTIAVAYLVIDRFSRPSESTFSLRFIELTGLIALYPILRSYSKYSTLFFYSCILGSIIQSVYGLFQLYGFYDSNNSNFDITGNFFNPGPYAGYILNGFCLSIGFYLYRDSASKQMFSQNFSLGRKQKFLMNIFFITGIVTTSLALSACKSRAAWLAILIGSTFLIFNYYGFFGKAMQRKRILRFRVLIIIATIITLILILIFLYYLNQNSSDGRILVWNVITKIISHHPFRGIGFDGFSSIFMDFQASYFELHPKSNFIYSAGDIRYAFNIFLLYFSENGIFFLVLILCFIVRLFLIRGQGSNLITIKAVVISQIVFALFSYPEQVLSIKLNLVCFLAFLASEDHKIKNILINKSFITLKTSILFICTFVLICSYNYLKTLHSAFESWNTASQIYSTGQYSASIIYFQAAYPVFHNDGEFLVLYGKTLLKLNNNKKALEVLLRAEDHLNNYIVQIAKGDCFNALQKNAAAERSYLKALHMIPTRLYPKYLLAKLYLKSNQKEKAIKTAKDILKTRIKINSSATKEITGKMDTIIKYKRLPSSEIIKRLNQSL